MRRSSLFLALLLSPAPGMASTYQALCGATAGAIGGALLLGPIGLLGGLIGGGLAGSKAGNTADLFFNVVGYDQEGRKTTVSFRFVNPRPASQLRTELPMFTGLAMGQTRPLADLQAALRTGTSGSSSGLPDRLDPAGGGAAPMTATPGAPASPQSRAAALPDRLATTPQTPADVTPEQAWHTYLQQRNLVDWARNNPQLAEQLRRRVMAQSAAAN